MKNKILDLVDSYWKFDNDQCPTSTWHDKQDLLQAIEDELGKQLADVRNKMSPISNLIALLNMYSKIGGFSGDYRIESTIKEEMIKSKESINIICQK